MCTHRSRARGLLTRHLFFSSSLPFPSSHHLLFVYAHLRAHTSLREGPFSAARLSRRERDDGRGGGGGRHEAGGHANGARLGGRGVAERLLVAA